MTTRTQYIVLSIILFLGLLVRLYKIDNPIADWHSWRQADTAAVTRNFVKYGINPFLPRYDDFSDVSGNGLFNPQGYRMVEFPIFNLVHYSLFSIFHFPSLEFWGRMTSVLSALTSAIFIFLIIRRRVDAFTGLFASGIYLLLPYNIYFTRVVLPEPMMTTLFLASLYFWDRGNLMLTALFGALAVLIKPTAIFFLTPITIAQIVKYRLNFYKTRQFLLLHSAFLLPFAIWRLWSHRFPQGIPASLWLLNGNKIRFKGAFFRWIFGERIGSLILGKWGIWPYVSGIISSKGYLLSWTGASMLYLFTFATGNVHHDYYQIPIIPSVAIMIALGARYLSKTWPQRLLVVTSLLFMIAFSWYDIRGLYQINNPPIVEAGQAVDKLVPKDAIVVAPYSGDTAFLYQTNRRGFPFMPLPIKDLKDNFGAMYYVSVNYDDATNAIMKKYIVLESTPRYVIVKLEEPIRP